MISQTREDLVRTGQPLEYFATAIYEETLGTNGVPRKDLENVVSSWSVVADGGEEQTLNRLKAQVSSVARSKNILRVKWVYSGNTWEL